MLSLLSPAKKLLTIDTPYLGVSSNPKFHQRSIELIQIMRNMTADDIRKLMKLSEKLAELNYQRYQDFHLENCPETASYPALFFFQGDVYQGLNASTLDEPSREYAQEHLGILSGLYGVLKPLDKIQAHRLEMGTRLSNEKGSNLYDFWGDDITKAINYHLSTQKNKVLLNLASQEYFKAVNTKKIKGTLINIHFKQEKNGQLKTVGIHAKRARGLMARFLIDERIDSPSDVKNFQQAGYTFQPTLSDESNYCFVQYEIKKSSHAIQ